METDFEKLEIFKEKDINNLKQQCIDHLKEGGDKDTIEEKLGVSKKFFQESVEQVLEKKYEQEPVYLDMNSLRPINPDDKHEPIYLPMKKQEEEQIYTTLDILEKNNTKEKEKSDKEPIYSNSENFRKTGNKSYLPQCPRIVSKKSGKKTPVKPLRQNHVASIKDKKRKLTDGQELHKILGQIIRLQEKIIKCREEKRGKLEEFNGIREKLGLPKINFGEDILKISLEEHGIKEFPIYYNEKKKEEHYEKKKNFLSSIMKKFR
jgi:hypothetical protein